MVNKTLKYRPEIFSVSNETEAKNIILTPAAGSSTDERWEKETEFLISDIGKYLEPDNGKVILDFGCGIGRLSKALIDRYGCYVIGVDISSSMRELAHEYVGDNRFACISNQFLAMLVKKGLKVDACIALWVLQHCVDAKSEVSFIHSILKNDGLFYVLNNERSAIPTDKELTGSDRANLL